MAFPHQANKQNSKTQAGNHYFEFIADAWLTYLAGNRTGFLEFVCAFQKKSVVVWLTLSSKKLL